MFIDKLLVHSTIPSASPLLGRATILALVMNVNNYYGYDGENMANVLFIFAHKRTLVSVHRCEIRRNAIGTEYEGRATSRIAGRLLEAANDPCT